jgi:hypothetical protein
LDAIRDYSVLVSLGYNERLEMNSFMHEKRDLGLDFLKGAGCVLMVIAHSKLKMWHYETFIFWGNLAAVLFFSVAGVTASFQAQRGSPRQVLLTYLFIFLLGFSYNGFINPRFLDHIQFEIIQTIALGAALVYLIERLFHPASWVYLLSGFASVGLNELIQLLLRGKEIAWVSGVVISPGYFPLLPWLSIFLMGVFAYRVQNRYNLLLFLVLGAFYFYLFACHIPTDTEGKWEFNFDYFLACAVLLFLAYFLVRSVALLRHPKIDWLVLFWGKNSLLFLYVHYALVKYFRARIAARS